MLAFTHILEQYFYSSYNNYIIWYMKGHIKSIIVAPNLDNRDTPDSLWW